MKAYAAFFAAAILAAAQTPTCEVGSGWKQKGEARQYEGDNLFEYMDGNSEGYFIYGFVRMHGVTCQKDGQTILIDISEMSDAENAYGIFSSNRDPQRPLESIGAGAQIVPRRAIFAKGKYFIEIAAQEEGDHAATLRELAKVLEARTPGETSKPEPLQWFPSEGLDPASARLMPQSVLGISALKRGYVAQYGQAKAFIVTEASPDAAAAVLDKLRARFAPTEKASVADDAFQANDRYLGRLCMFRKGRRLGGFAAVPEGSDPAALAAKLAAAMPAQ
jgi:hypothetical protein